MANEPQPLTLPKWEYKVNSIGHINELQSMCNAMGDKGWELDKSFIGKGGDYIIVFKRQRKTTITIE